MAHYRKTYLCICEGQQEVMYLGHVASLIKKFPQRVVTFNTMIDKPFRLKKRYEEYDRAAFFDYDFNDIEFKKNIELCEQMNNANKPTQRKQGQYTYHAFSNVNFDLWLILHKEDFNRPVHMNNGYVSDVRRIYDLGSSENIKSESVIKKILDQITLEDVKSAIQRASSIREGKMDTDKMFIGSTVYYPNPDFSIHEFLKVILVNCGEL